VKVAPPLTLQRLNAHWEPGAVAVLRELKELHYVADLAELLAEDLPPYVRAVSAVRRWQGGMVFVQDDVSALALGDAHGGQLKPLLLPRGPGGRRRFEKALGNKADKLDLEAMAVLPDGRLLVFGSGSTPARESIVVVAPDLSAQLIDASGLYAHLRAQGAFAGSELNIEGALVLGPVLRLLQRGNGASRTGTPARDAFGDLPLAAVLAWLDGNGPHPTLQHIVQVELGDYHGKRLTLTDATQLGTGTLLITASAEASPNAVDDGEVSCSCVGVLREDGFALFPIVDEAGLVLQLKVEGIEPCSAQGTALHVVVDSDDASKPALLGTVHLKPPLSA
jgi:hypothetical protein